MAIIKGPVITLPPQKIWSQSNHGPALRQPNGWHIADASFISQLWQQPEVLPVDESCSAERRLHDQLVNDPTLKVQRKDVEAIDDPDARENYTIALKFRDRLIKAKTIEAYYLSLFRSGNVAEPAVLINLLTRTIAHSIIINNPDAFSARTAELFFREQQASIQNGAVLLGDLETIRHLGRTAGMGSLGSLVTMSGTQPRKLVLDVLSNENAEQYWQRSHSFDFILDLTYGRTGIDSLSRVLECWITHFLEIEVQIQPVQEINDNHWVWHIGLDTEATALLNDLYNDATVEDDRMQRLLSLYRLDFKDPRIMRSDIAGRPVYLGLCMTKTGRVRLKPQNLLVNLPLASDI